MPPFVLPVLVCVAWQVAGVHEWIGRGMFPTFVISTSALGDRIGGA